MYTNFYVYMVYRQYMSGKLYWRYKKNGKWTWKPLVTQSSFEEQLIHRMYTRIAEEEE